MIKLLKKLKGSGIYPALTIGVAKIYKKLTLRELAGKISGKKLDIKSFEQAIEVTKKELEALYESLTKKGNKQLAEIMDFQLLLLEDDEFIGKMKEAISKGVDVGKAVLEVVENTKAMFESMDNPYMRERASDIIDLGYRILKNIIGMKELQFTKDTIIIAEELTPSEVVSVAGKIRGIVTSRGNALSHFAIIARELGIPTIVGVKDLIQNVKDGDIIALNGLSGQLIINPSKEEREKFEEIKKRWDVTIKEILEKAKEEARLKSGEKISVVANLGRIEEAETAKYYGAEGVGLFRTEFFFLGRDTPPSEDEQFNGFKFVVNQLSPGSISIRTLDIGSDKQIPYIPLPQEPNPALGKRAIRLYGDELKEIIMHQIKAILRAAKYGNVGIMLPMVADASEIIKSKELIEKAKKELSREGKEFGKPRIGIMIEIPSAALMADLLAPLVDFMSIGSNDLTQYTLAADRAGIFTLDFFDHLHPAVLRLIKHTVDALKGTNVELSVCGESASDIYAVPILIGLGIRKLSSAPLIIPVIKYIIRQFDIKDLENLAKKALNKTSPKEVRELVREFYISSNISLPIL